MVSAPFFGVGSLSTRQSRKKPHWVEGGTRGSLWSVQRDPPVQKHTHTGRKKRTGEVESEFGGIREVAWRVRRRLVEKPVCV
jgi:hypothetical protein